MSNPGSNPGWVGILQALILLNQSLLANLTDLALVSNADSYSALAQQFLQRGQLIEQFRLALPPQPDEVDESLQPQLHEGLETLKQQDLSIGKALSGCQADLADQLKQLKATQSVLPHYRSQNEEAAHTRNA